MIIAYVVGLAVNYIASLAGLIALSDPTVALDDERTIFVMLFPPFRLPEFILGIGVGVLFMRYRDVLDKHVLLLIWGGLIGVLAGMIAGGLLIPLPYVFKTALAPFMACFLLGIACRREGLSRLCGTIPMVLLGQASYALYILHLPLLLVFMQWPLPAHIPGIVTAALYLGVTISASVLVYLFCEKPCQMIIRKWLKIKG